MAGALLAGIAATTFFTGCGRNPAGQEAAGMMNAPPEVGVVTLAPESVALTTELPGRIDPVRVAQVRARVDGIVLHREFREGADVTAGEVLYQIDPAPFKAASTARARLLRRRRPMRNRPRPWRTATSRWSASTP